MIRRPPRSTRTDTLFPYTTLFRSGGTSGELYVFLHGKTIKFLLSGGAYVPANGDGSTLVKSALEQYTYTSPDGAVYYFQRVHADNQKMIGAMHIRAYLMTVTRPDGRKIGRAHV